MIHFYSSSDRRNMIGPRGRDSNGESSNGRPNSTTSQPNQEPLIPPAGTPGTLPSKDLKLKHPNPRLAQFMDEYKINREFASRLHVLADCDIVILCDDSGSMKTQLQRTNQTRWDELKSVRFNPI